MVLHFALLNFITSCVKVITFRVVITSCVNGITSRGDYYILRQYYILRRNRRPSNSFSSLWAAFTLSIHINALYKESILGKEEHASCINTIALKISHLFGFSVSCDSLACLRLDSRYSISLFNSIVCDYPVVLNIDATCAPVPR